LLFTFKYCLMVDFYNINFKHNL